MSNAIITELESLVAKFRGEEKTVVADVEGAASAGMTYLKSKVPNSAQAIAEGESLLVALGSGVSWPDAASQLIAQCAKAGIELVTETATIVLNYAQSNLIAQSKITVPTA